MEATKNYTQQSRKCFRLEHIDNTLKTSWILPNATSKVRDFQGSKDAALMNILDTDLDQAVQPFLFFG
jgi:hypothetical protein